MLCSSVTHRYYLTEDTPWHEESKMNLALIKFILYGSLYVLVSENFYVSGPSVFWNVNGSQKVSF